MCEGHRLDRDRALRGVELRPLPADGKCVVDFEYQLVFGRAERADHDADPRRTAPAYILLIEPLPQLAARQTALEHDVALFAAARELVNKAVLAALGILLYLQLDLQTGAFAETGSRNGVEL